MPLTSRERVQEVLRGVTPDRVPVMPGYGTWYASRVCGHDLFDIEEGRVSSAEIIAGITRRYGCEVWYWQGYGDDIEEIWSDGRSQCDVAREILDEDNYVETLTMRSPDGVISKREVHNRCNPAHAISGLIKAPSCDWPIYRDCRGDRWKWATTTSLSEVPEDDLSLGITSFALALPVDFWKDLRCDTGSALLDMCDGEPVMEEAMEWHSSYSMQKLNARLQIEPVPDMIHLQGSSSSLSVISPSIYKRYNLDFINRACVAAHSKGVPVQIHHCGKSAELVEILYDGTDIDIIHPLEPPPGGNVDLACVKKRFGGRLVLMGNLNTYQLMQYGTPAEVKSAAKRCIDDAAEGGRFILTTGDQIGRDTPESNVMAMVEAAHEYGIY